MLLPDAACPKTPSPALPPFLQLKPAYHSSSESGSLSSSLILRPSRQGTVAPAPTTESCLEDSSWGCSRAPSFRGLNSDPHSFSMNWVCLKARVRTAVGSSVRAGDREVRGGVAGGLACLQVRIAKLNRSIPAEMQVSGPGRGWQGSQQRGQPRNKEVLERGCWPEFQSAHPPPRATQEVYTHPQVL